MLLLCFVALLGLGATAGYRPPPSLSPRCDRNNLSRLKGAASDDAPQKGWRGLMMFRKDDMMKLKDQLGGAGQAGLISYGVLNLCYYSVVTLIFWSLTAGNLANEPLLRRLSKVSAMVWLGSQATKPTRMAGAIVMAPVADKYMTSFQERFKIQSRTKTFWLLFTLILSTMFAFYGALLATTLLFQRLA